MRSKRQPLNHLHSFSAAQPLGQRKIQARESLAAQQPKRSEQESQNKQRAQDLLKDRQSDAVVF